MLDTQPSLCHILFAEKSEAYLSDMKRYFIMMAVLMGHVILMTPTIWGQSPSLQDSIYDPGKLKPRDSILKVKAGQIAPDFSLPAVSGKTITLSQFEGKKNVVISFVPAAFTPVCSDQWPGYNLVRNMFDENDAILLGITVDNLPTLYAWTRQMGDLWFEVLSDFWPHGAVADKYGVLRSDGVSERALFFIDKNGIISGVLVMDINRRPDLESCATELKKMKEK
jgi:peroxiredoxin (alkyl hydroperoxide reductase subunit C)